MAGRIADADVALTPLNLCGETLDGVRKHSWSRPAPGTPEGEVVSWADRVAYSAHDLEDAAAEGIVSGTDLYRGDARGAGGRLPHRRRPARLGPLTQRGAQESLRPQA